MINVVPACTEWDLTVTPTALMKPGGEMTVSSAERWSTAVQPATLGNLEMVSVIEECSTVVKGTMGRADAKRTEL